MRVVSVFIVWFTLGAATARSQTVELESSFPANNTRDVSVSDSIQLRLGDAIDLETLDAITLRLANNVQGKRIPVRRATDLTNASITLVPYDFLEPSTQYVVIGTDQLRTASGTRITPFQFSFTTGDEPATSRPELQFESETFDATRSMTTILFGPDRRLYAASAFGELVCWDIDANGRPVNRQTLLADPALSRQYIDLEWDPNADSNNLQLWVSYASRLTPRSDPRTYFTGTISRLTIRGETVAREQAIVVGLPHGREVQGGHETLPHQPNGLCFRDGKLYQSVGSTSSSGGPANWGVPEQRLSACVIEIDYQRIGENPVDVFPGNVDFDPFEEDSSVRHYSTGIRNALEIIAHSNGRLYTAVNMNDRGKRSDGVPDAPSIPGDQNELVKTITPDHESLYILERGAHYGFPNPSIGNYILGGGNPTAAIDPFEIPDYPIGTQPDKGFDPELMFPIWQWGGTSPNGMLEYQPAFEHPLREAILCCFYSANDIAAISLGEDGRPTKVAKLRGRSGKLPFLGPLDITQDPKTGNLYIADFGKQSSFGEDGSLVMLRPLAEIDASQP